MRDIFHKINRKLAEICGWFLLVIMTLLITDLITRGLGKPIHGLTPIAVFVMLAVIYLGLPRCEEYHEHVRVEVIINLMSPKVVDRVGLIIYIIEIFVIGLFLKEMLNNLIISYITEEAISGTVILPVWPSKLAMFIGLIFYWVQIFINLIKSATQFKQRKYNADIETVKEEKPLTF